LNLLCDKRLALCFDAELRWSATLLALDRLIATVPISLDARRELVEHMKRVALELLKLPREFEATLSQRYRGRREAVERFLLHQDPRANQVATLLHARDRTLTRGFRRLAALERSGELTTTVYDVGRSLAHLLVTRMTTLPARTQELTLM